MVRRKHINPYAERRLRELTGWLSTPRLIAALAEAVKDVLAHVEQREPDEGLTPARRAYRALIDGRRLSAAELAGEGLSPAELAFHALVADRQAYARWAAGVRAQWERDNVVWLAGFREGKPVWKRERPKKTLD